MAILGTEMDLRSVRPELLGPMLVGKLVEKGVLFIKLDQDEDTHFSKDDRSGVAVLADLIWDCANQVGLSWHTEEWSCIEMDPKRRILLIVDPNRR
ncbi:MAG: hypothetical protein RIQ56_486 [Candidatus Parcubacteria bacterium]|jgi:hypothetical protein